VQILYFRVNKLQKALLRAKFFLKIGRSGRHKIQNFMLISDLKRLSRKKVLGWIFWRKNSFPGLSFFGIFFLNNYSRSEISIKFWIFFYIHKGLFREKKSESAEGQLNSAQKCFNQNWRGLLDMYMCIPRDNNDMCTIEYIYPPTREVCIFCTPWITQLNLHTFNRGILTLCINRGVITPIHKKVY
jgi:hypothetical protein